MINLCFLISVAKNQGPCNVLYNIAKSLDKTVYNVHLVTLYKGNDKNVIHKFYSKGISVKELNYHNRMQCFLKSKKDLQEYCDRNDIGIIHSHTFFSDFTTLKVKNVYKVSTIHNRPFEDYSFLYGRFIGSFIARIHIKILRNFDKCVCCSKSVFHEQQKYLNNIIVVQNGVEVPQANNQIKKSDLNIPDDSLVYIYVGSINKRKNVTNLVRLFTNNRESNEYLLVLGSGEEVDACYSLADAHTLFLGFVNPINYYAISDVYVSASLSEGLSLSQLESMSFGLKQLVSDIPSHREVVDISSEIGYVFDDNTYSVLHKRIINEISQNSRNEIQKIFNEYFSIEKMVKGYIDVYSSVGC